jgi:hypothetical protein
MASSSYSFDYGTPAPAAPASSAATTTFPGTTAATTGAIASGLTAYSQLPGYQASIANIGSAVQSETAGQVPADVIAQLQQQGAEGNAQTGAASNAAYLHALGLTSLGLESQGAQTLNQTVQQLPGAQVSQNPAYYQNVQQNYEAQLQQQVSSQQQQQQALAIQQQQQALATAQQSSQVPTTLYGAGDTSAPQWATTATTNAAGMTVYS